MLANQASRSLASVAVSGVTKLKRRRRKKVVLKAEKNEERDEECRLLFSTVFVLHSTCFALCTLHSI